MPVASKRQGKTTLPGKTLVIADLDSRPLFAFRKPLLVDQFIEISPGFFDHLSRGARLVDAIPLRDMTYVYKDGKEDMWGSPEEHEEVDVNIYLSEASMEKLVYIPRKGRLYICDDLLLIAELITALREIEKTKILQ